MSMNKISILLIWLTTVGVSLSHARIERAQRTNRITQSLPYVLPLAQNATNYLQNVTSGTTYGLQNSSVSMNQVLVSSGVVSPNVYVSNNLVHVTTETIEARLIAVGVATSVIGAGSVLNSTIAATNPFNGLWISDGQTSTSGFNWGLYKLTLPPDYLATSTPALVFFQTISTGARAQQEAYSMSFSSIGLQGVAGLQKSGIQNIVINTTGTVPIVFFTSPTVATTSNGGAVDFTTRTFLNGSTAIFGANRTVYVNFVRDGATSGFDPSDSQSLVNVVLIEIKRQR